MVCLFQLISLVRVNEGLDSLKVGERPDSLKAFHSYTDRDKCASVLYTTENTSF